MDFFQLLIDNRRYLTFRNSISVEYYLIHRLTVVQIILHMFLEQGDYFIRNFFIIVIEFLIGELNFQVFATQRNYCSSRFSSFIVGNIESHHYGIISIYTISDNIRNWTHFVKHLSYHIGVFAQISYILFRIEVSEELRTYWSRCQNFFPSFIKIWIKSTEKENKINIFSTY